MRQRKAKLDVRSTIDGEIGLLDVELGQSISPGQKIGVINDLSDYKVEAQVDEHYIDRGKKDNSKKDEAEMLRPSLCYTIS